MKLHMVGQHGEGTIPFPEMIALTDTSENDLTVFKLDIIHGVLVNNSGVLPQKNQSVWQQRNGIS